MIFTQEVLDELLIRTAQRPGMDLNNTIAMQLKGHFDMAGKKAANYSLPINTAFNRLFTSIDINGLSAEGFIKVDAVGYSNFTIKNNLVYETTSDTVLTQPVRFHIAVRPLPEFADLPYEVAEYILASAAMGYMVANNGDSSQIGYLANTKQASVKALRSYQITTGRLNLNKVIATNTNPGW